ncbi:MAG: alpha/beta fold hydrolase, partial [Acidimicrobiales bacterium]|nr:alpha/beta fold hydrolase [Acidimicrobiales bacterium]
MPDQFTSPGRAERAGSPGQEEVHEHATHEVSFDVSRAVRGASQAVIAGSVVVPPAGVPVRPTVVLAVPGGTYPRAYWHPSQTVLPGYSFCDHLAAAGYVTVAVDNIGTGLSSPADGLAGTPEVFGELLHIAACEARTRAADGTLAPGLAAISEPEVVGIGHSLGGRITMLQQAVWRTYDRIGVFGYTALTPPDARDQPIDERVQKALEGLRAAAGVGPDAEFAEMPRVPLRPFFYGPFVSEEVMSADESLATSMGLLAGACASVSGYASRAASEI